MEMVLVIFQDIMCFPLSIRRCNPVTQKLNAV